MHSACHVASAFDQVCIRQEIGMTESQTWDLCSVMEWKLVLMLPSKLWNTPSSEQYSWSDDVADIAVVLAIILELDVVPLLV